MKKLFAAFWNRNLAFAKLAIVTNLEYRLNYFIDALVQPTLTTGIEILLWMGVFAGAGTAAINGYGIDSYLSYALWAAFFTRISTSWMYEFKMIEEVSSGTLNSIIVRPMGFYEYLFKFHTKQVLKKSLPLTQDLFSYLMGQGILENILMKFQLLKNY